MSESVNSAEYKVTAAAKWETIGNGEAPVLSVTIAGSSAPHSVELLFPEELRPKSPDAFFGDTQVGTGRASEIGQDEGPQWKVNINEPPKKVADAKQHTWSVRLNLTSPGAFTSMTLLAEARSPSGGGKHTVKVEIVARKGGKPMESDVSLEIPPHKPNASYAVRFWGELVDVAGKENDEAKKAPATVVRAEQNSRVALKWTLEGVRGAELTGPLANGERRRVLAVTPDAKGTEEKVYAVASTRYTLTAQVERSRVPDASPGSELVTIERNVEILVQTDRQFGGTLRLQPKLIFPGGPVACWVSYFNVRSARILGVDGTDMSSLQHPNEKRPDTGVLTMPFQGSLTLHRLEDPTLMLDGPVPGQSAEIVDRERVRDRASETLTPKDEHHHLILEPGGAKNDLLTHELKKKPAGTKPAKATDARGIAAGFFGVEKLKAREQQRDSHARDGSSQEVGPNAAPAIGSATRQLVQIERTFIAAATDKGLDITVHRRLKTYDLLPWQMEHIELDSLTKQLQGDFLGVGAADSWNEGKPDGRNQVLVAVRRDGAKVSVLELAFPLDTGRPGRKKDERDAIRRFELQDTQGFLDATEVGVLTVGPRVFLIGQGAALSYDRTASEWTATRLEPQLAFLSAPGWDTAALPGPSNGGWIFALQRRTGLLLRFDVNGEKQTVSEPTWMCPAFSDVVPLDKLLAFQRGDLSLAALGTWKMKDSASTRPGDRIVAFDTVDTGPSPVLPLEELPRLVAFDGILLVLGAPARQSAAPQDRAYDPQSDRWVACGRPFGPWKKGVRVGSAGNSSDAKTGASMFARSPGGALQAQVHVSHHLVGFVGRRTPFEGPSPSSETPRNVEDRLVAGGAPLLPGELLLSQNRRFMARLEGKAFVVRSTLTDQVLHRLEGSDDLVSASVLSTGELVLYQSDIEALHSGTQHQKTPAWRVSGAGDRFSKPAPGAALVLGNDGSLACVAPGRCDHLLTPDAFPFKVGNRLLPGHHLASKNRGYRLSYQPDGNLVLRGPTGDLWQSETKGPAGCVVLHPDGNLAIHKASPGAPDKPESGAEEWGAHLLGGAYDLAKYKNASPHLELEDSGALSVRAGDDELWHAPRVLGDRLRTGAFMVPGDKLVWETATLELTRQGNLVATGPSGVVWQSYTESSSVWRAVMGSDGNLVLLQQDRTKLFSTATYGGPIGWTGVAELNLYRDGTVRVFVPDSRGILWSTDWKKGDSLAFSAAAFGGSLLPGSLANAFKAPPEAKLKAGQWLESPARAYRLVMEQDGALTLFDRVGQMIWRSPTGGGPGQRGEESTYEAMLNHDGGLLVRGHKTVHLETEGLNADPRPYFMRCAALKMDDTRGFVIYGPDSTPWFAPSIQLLGPSAQDMRGQGKMLDLVQKK